MKKKINVIILIIFTGLVLYFTLKDNFTETIDKILSINLLYILVAFLLIFLYWIFKAYTIYSFSKKMNPDISFKSSFQLILRTQFFNAVTPFASGGQPYQIYYLKQTGLEYTESTGVVLESSIVYQICIIVLGLIAIIVNNIFHIFPKAHLLQKLVALGFAVNVLVFVVMFVLAFTKKINKFLINTAIKLLTVLHIVKDKEKALKKWNNTINDFHNSALLLLKDKKIFIANIIYNFIGICCLYLIPYFIILATGEVSLLPHVSLISCAYVMIIGAFVPIPGATGGLEYGFMQFFGNFMSGGTLSAVMLVWRFITYYFGIIMGSIALNIKRVK